MRGWTEADLSGLASENILRVLKGVEETAKYLRSVDVKPNYDIYDERTDL